MLDLIAEVKVFIMQREDLWMIVDDIYKLALLFMCHLNSSPNIRLGRQAIYFCLEIKILRFHIRSRAKRWFLTGGGRFNIRCYSFNLF